MSEIIFEVTEDEVDGGHSASAIGYGIHTLGVVRWRKSAETSAKRLPVTVR